MHQIPATRAAALHRPDDLPYAYLPEVSPQLAGRKSRLGDRRSHATPQKSKNSRLVDFGYVLDLLVAAELERDPHREHLVDTDDDVVTEDLRKHLAPHRGVGLRPHRVAEFPLHT